MYCYRGRQEKALVCMREGRGMVWGGGRRSSGYSTIPSQADLSHLFLSSSFDWTVRLWSMKPQNEHQLTVRSVPMWGDVISLVLFFCVPAFVSHAHIHSPHLSEQDNDTIVFLRAQ